MDITLIDAALLLTVLIAISVGSLLKGMTGLGLPIFAVPAIALVATVEDAVVIMILPSIAANLWIVATRRQHMQLLKAHLPFLICGFIGALLGTAVLALASSELLKLFLAIWLGLYLIQYFVGQRAAIVFGAGKFSGYPLGLASGILQGATGISAQVVAPYYHARKATQDTYAFLVAFSFLVFASAQISASVNLDLMSGQRLQLSLMALVPTLIFTKVGMALSGRITQTAFNRILLLTFAVMEVKLLLDIYGQS